MALLGLIGGPLFLIGQICAFDWWEPTSAAGLLVAPEFLWELSLGIYAAVWGFRRDAPILSGARRATPQSSRRSVPPKGLAMKAEAA